MKNRSSPLPRTLPGQTSEANCLDADQNPREPLFRLEERLLREERNIADALLRRSRLLAEIASRKKDHGSRSAAGRPLNQALEKALWSAWEDVLPPSESGRFPHWRQLVSQCNNLGYILGEQHGQHRSTRAGNAWLLRPMPVNGAVTLPAPTQALCAETAIFWAAMTNAHVHIRRVPFNDSVIELMKALNQTGARFTWEQGIVVHAPTSGVALEVSRKTIHVGHSPVTLALLMAWAVTRPGVTTFSGSGALNMLSLKPWQQFLPQLGTRLHQLNPHAPGLPVRLEANGLPEQALIGSDTPRELIRAMLTIAPLCPQGLRLVWDESLEPAVLASEVEDITRLYDLYGIPYRSQPDAITVAHALPRLPRSQESHPAPASPDAFQVLPDPTLSAMLMLWSRFTDHAMRLEGKWPEGPGATLLLDLLRSCGMRMEKAPDLIRVKFGPWPKEPVLDLHEVPTAMPLATSLALGAPGTSVLTGLPGEYDRDAIAGLAQWAGRTCHVDGRTMTFRPHPGIDHRDTQRNCQGFEAPDGYWAVALAMLTFKHPGAKLLNPEAASGLWPDFWVLYNHVLSTARKRPEDAAAKNPKQPAGPKGVNRTSPTGEHTAHAAERPAQTKRRVKL